MDAECSGIKKEEPASSYLLACREEELREYQKQLLYEILGPVFFGRKQAGTLEELQDLFRRQYGIDVQKDFYDGDEHYEEYMEAKQALNDGLSIYSGQIAFKDTCLADYAGEIWEDMEREEKGKFRRINTLLEE